MCWVQAPQFLLSKSAPEHDFAANVDLRQGSAIFNFWQEWKRNSEQ